MPRNIELTQLAGTLRRKGMDETEILETLRNAPERDGLPESELRGIARSIGSKPPGPPNRNQNYVHAAYADALHEWAAHRGWTVESVRALGATASGDGIVEIPMRDSSGRIIGRRLRRSDDQPFLKGSKAITRAGSKNGLICPWPLPAQDPVLLVEGEADACAALSAGWPSVMATPGAKPGRAISKFIQETLAGRAVVLAPHPDQAGRDWLDTQQSALANAQVEIRYIPALTEDLDGQLRVVSLTERPPILRQWIESALFYHQKPARALSAADPKTPSEALVTFNLTDDGNGLAIELIHADQLKFDWGIGRTGQWRVWRGSHWGLDNDGASARLAIQTVKARGRAAFEIDMPKPDRFALANFALRCENEGRLLAALDAAKRQPRIATTQATWDQNPMLLACPNVTVDLSTGQSREPSPADYISRCAGTTWDPAATCPRFTRFLQEIFDNDPDLIAFIQRAVGYSLTGEVSEQCFFILYGTGKNGKSTFLKILGLLLGDYARNADFQTFIPQKYPGAARDDIARLAGARFVSAKESYETAHLDEGIIKTLTGDDVVTTRHLYLENFEYVPQFKLWLAVNHRPTITGADDGIWRRVRLVPFTRQFTREIDPSLLQTLKSELPGILAWAVQGCLQWRAADLGWPTAVKSATEIYRTDMDLLGAFLDSLYTPSPLGQESAADLYHSYLDWAASNGEKQISQRALGLKLHERGFFKKKTTNGIVWLGLSLKHQ